MTIEPPMTRTFRRARRCRSFSRACSARNRRSSRTSRLLIRCGLGTASRIEACSVRRCVAISYVPASSTVDVRLHAGAAESRGRADPTTTRGCPRSVARGVHARTGLGHPADPSAGATRGLVDRPGVGAGRRRGCWPASPSCSGAGDRAGGPSCPAIRSCATPRSSGCAGCGSPRCRLVFEMTAAAVLEQKVTGREARRVLGHPGYVRRHGAAAPGPVPAGLMVAPPAAVWRRIPSWDWHRAGVDGKRARTDDGGRGACLTTWNARSRSTDPAPILRQVPGIGIWTAAEVMQRAHGDRGRGVVRRLPHPRDGWLGAGWSSRSTMRADGRAFLLPVGRAPRAGGPAGGGLRLPQAALRSPVRRRGLPRDLTSASEGEGRARSEGVARAWGGGRPADRDGTAGFVVGGQVRARRGRHRGRTSVEEIQAVPRPSAANATRSDWTAAPIATTNIRSSAAWRDGRRGRCAHRRGPAAGRPSRGPRVGRRRASGAWLMAAASDMPSRA